MIQQIAIPVLIDIHLNDIFKMHVSNFKARKPNPDGHDYLL